MTDSAEKLTAEATAALEGTTPDIDALSGKRSAAPATKSTEEA